MGVLGLQPPSTLRSPEFQSLPQLGTRGAQGLEGPAEQGGGGVCSERARFKDSDRVPLPNPELKGLPVDKNSILCLVSTWGQILPNPSQGQSPSAPLIMNIFTHSFTHSFIHSSSSFAHSLVLAIRTFC